VAVASAVASSDADATSNSLHGLVRSVLATAWRAKILGHRRVPRPCGSKTLGHSLDDEYHHSRDGPEGDRDEQRCVGHERALRFAPARLRRVHELEVAE
jgi:hypothetical protein